MAMKLMIQTNRSKLVDFIVSTEYVVEINHSSERKPATHYIESKRNISLLFQFVKET